MGRKAREDSVVERTAERHMQERTAKFIHKDFDRPLEEEAALADKVVSIFARDLRMHDKIYEGRRGGKVRFKEVKKILFSRRNQKVYVNDEWVYDYYLGKVLVLR